MADFKVYLLRQYACNQKTNGELWYSVYPRLPVNTDTHYFSRLRTHNLPIVSPSRYHYR